jgi:hypothetical protein
MLATMTLNTFDLDLFEELSSDELLAVDGGWEGYLYSGGSIYLTLNQNTVGSLAVAVAGMVVSPYSLISWAGLYYALSGIVSIKP